MEAKEWYAKSLNKTVDEFDEYDMYIADVIKAYGKELSTQREADTKEFERIYKHASDQFVEVMKERDAFSKAIDKQNKAIVMHLVDKTKLKDERDEVVGLLKDVDTDLMVVINWLSDNKDTDGLGADLLTKLRKKSQYFLKQLGK